jgi:hypothetical protein
MSRASSIRIGKTIIGENDRSHPPPGRARAEGKEMSEPTSPENKLEEHLAVVGRVIAKFVSQGLAPQAIDTFAPEAFLHTPVDRDTFEAVIVWMLDEGIIRAKQRIETLDGRLRLMGVQLTSKGLAIVQEPLPSGDSIAKRVQSNTGSGAFWSSIGELVGSIAGSFTKSIGSG